MVVWLGRVEAGRGLEPVVVDGFAVGAVRARHLGRGRRPGGRWESGRLAIGRDLQRAVLVAHCVVARDDAVLLGAEDVLERAGKSHEGRRVKRALCAGQKSSSRKRLASAMVAIPARRSSWGRRFCKDALRAAPGLRRIGRDQLDAELRQGPADLGRVVLDIQ